MNVKKDLLAVRKNLHGEVGIQLYVIFEKSTFGHIRRINYEWYELLN